MRCPNLNSILFVYGFTQRSTTQHKDNETIHSFLSDHETNWILFKAKLVVYLEFLEFSGLCWELNFLVLNPAIIILVVGRISQLFNKIRRPPMLLVVAAAWWWLSANKDRLMTMFNLIHFRGKCLRSHCFCE